METATAVRRLAALAHDTRLAVFRSLVQAGAGGLAASDVAQAVGAPASTMSFHLKELMGAGLIAARQDGRFIFYSAEYAAMTELVAFLTEKCCQGMPATQAARIGKAVAACCTPRPQSPTRSPK